MINLKIIPLEAIYNLNDFNRELIKCKICHGLVRLPLIKCGEEISCEDCYKNKIDE